MNSLFADDAFTFNKEDKPSKKGSDGKKGGAVSKAGAMSAANKKKAARVAAALEESVFGVQMGTQIGLGGDDIDGTGRGAGAGGAGAGGRSGGEDRKRKPAWVDEDDADLNIDVRSVARLRKLREDEDDSVLRGDEYNKRLRKQFAQGRNVKWLEQSEAQKRRDAKKAEAKVKKQQKKDGGVRDGDGGSDSDSDGDDSSDDEAYTGGDVEDILRRTDALTTTSGVLQKGLLDVERLADGNKAEYSNCVLQSVKFHPNAQLLATAGLDKTLRLFHIDGRDNAKVQGVYVSDLPIENADFTRDGLEVILTGRRKFFYVYDIASSRVQKVQQIVGRTDKEIRGIITSADNATLAVLGNHGHISLLSRKTKQRIAELKMPGSVRSGVFSSDGTSLYTAGAEGTVYDWDIGTRRCRRVLRDQSAFQTTTLALSPDDQHLACGFESGIVSVYDLGAAAAAPATSAPGATIPLPLVRNVENLTTRIDNLRFNADGQVLVAASRSTKDALKMIHSPSYTTFSNWPTAGTPFHYISALDFSPNGALMAVGNDRGKALIYRLKHYKTV